MTFVSAGFSYHEIRLTNGTVIMENHTFNIPEGYVEDMNFEKVNTQYTNTRDLSYSLVVFNETNSSNHFKIYVTYITAGGEITTLGQPANSTNTTINGIDGYLFTENNMTYFTYLKNGNIVEISSNLGTELFEKIL